MPFPLVAKELRIQASAFYEVRDFEIAADVLDHDGDAPRAMVTDVIGGIFAPWIPPPFSLPWSPIRAISSGRA
jgi:hypothetical protein